MRLGQMNGLVRHEALSGSRPRQPKDQRYKSAYLSGAVCPARGTGAALMMPIINTHAMQAHLHEISHAAAPGAHPALSMDRADWRVTAALRMPNTITPILPSSRAPERNRVENVWQHLRQTHLSNRIFHDHDPAIDAACQAWNRLIERPWRIVSISLRRWAHNGQCE